VNYWDECEADFARFYGIDLRDGVEAETARRVWVLVKALPEDAAVMREAAEKSAPPKAISVAEFTSQFANHAA